MMYEKFERISLVNILQNLVFIFLVIDFAHSMIWSDVGFLRYHKLKSKLEEKQVELQQLEQEVVVVQKDIYRWETDNFYSQKMAREELQMGYSDEVVYLINKH